MSTEILDKQGQLASYWNYMFKNAMVHKAEDTKRWTEYWEAYRGEYFKNKKLPDYRSNLVSNYIFSIIETIRPIMLDNDPKFQSVPRQPDGLKFASDLQEVLSYEWDREKMNRKLYRELITTLVTGTSVFFIPWDKEKKNVRAIPVNPFNLFPDPLATCVEDAEYIIYATYKNAVRLQRMFPKLKEKLVGGSINYSELVHENDKNAQVDDQILILEVWTKDNDSHVHTIEGRDGQKYEKGRVLTIAPELGLILEDKPMPYEDGEHPFELIKDYDVPGKFWGEGEVAQLISPQKYMNELANAVVDSAKLTANSPWIVDKNAGIPQGALTSRQGLVIRKTPGSIVERLPAPNMPQYVLTQIDAFKGDMEQISGVFDTLKGNSETGVYTAQGILALQEAGQARIRLKVKLMEESLGRIAQRWFSRMRQFWKEDRFIQMARVDGTYDLKKFLTKNLKHDYDIRITAGSTMPVNRGAMLDLMIRLAQTQMPDGQMLVDRQAVAEYLPEEVKSAMIRRMNGQQGQIEQQLQQLQQGLQQLAQQNEQIDNDQSTTIEQLVGAMEQINAKILQQEEERARLKQEEETNKIKETSYNEGFKDAEKLAQPGELEEGLGEDPAQSMAMPDDVLSGIEEMSDDELALLLESNPELADVLE